MTTIEQLAGITSQHNEIVKRVGNGSLDPVTVKWALHDIIEGNLPTLAWSPPEWWRTAEQQLKRARQLWPDTTLPEPPKNFRPRKSSEVLLLHVPDTFDSLWDKVVGPPGHIKQQWQRVNVDKQHLRLSPKKDEYTKPVWLSFDPEYGIDEDDEVVEDVDDVMIVDVVNYAASEVLSALIQFPDWPLWWSKGASAPNLKGYQIKHKGSWSYVPYISRWSDECQLNMDGRPVSKRHTGWAYPSVREC
jgi:hypothetical protein